MNIIPITPATLDIIEVLNGGVRPELEDEETFFIYHKDAPAEIVHQDAIEKLPEYWAVIKILYRNIS
jgi:hypothetical protein